jgi:hypothetical protein
MSSSPEIAAVSSGLNDSNICEDRNVDDDIISILNHDEEAFNTDFPEKSPYSVRSRYNESREQSFLPDESVGEESSPQPIKEYTNKIFDLISTAQSRAYNGDEWENDDDTGYITISLTEDEFFEFENVSPLSLLSLV